MRLLIALRLFSESHAKLGIEANRKNHGPNGRLIDIQIERFHPALKNIIDYLRASDRLPALRQGQVLRTVEGKKIIERSENCRLYWCEVETQLEADFWQSLAEVEMVIEKEEFMRFAQSIRCRSGSAYINACEEYAAALPIKPFQPICYEPPRPARTSRAA